MNMIATDQERRKGFFSIGESSEEDFGLSLKKKSIELLSITPLIDGHNDLAQRILSFRKENIPIELHLDKPLSDSEKEILKEHGKELHTDLPRMREGRVGAQFWAVFTDCEIRGIESERVALESFSLLSSLFKKHSKELKQVFTSKELEETFYKDRKIASLIGVEGGQMISHNISLLDRFYNLGARYLTLTHNCHTEWADSCCDNEEKRESVGGISALGERIIRKMNQLGMIIDLSHASDVTMRHAMKISDSPVIFSHSNVRSLCNHPRNVPDDILLQLQQNGGIIMISFVPFFLTEEERIEHERIKNMDEESGKDWRSSGVFNEDQNQQKKRASIHDVLDHIDYIKNLHGNTLHIGIGSDFDGIPRTPVGLEDTSKFPKLVEELVNRGYKDQEIRQIIGENFLRVFRHVDMLRSERKCLDNKT